MSALDIVVDGYSVGYENVTEVVDYANDARAEIDALRADLAQHRTDLVKLRGELLLVTAERDELRDAVKSRDDAIQGQVNVSKELREQLQVYQRREALRQ